MNRRLLSLVLLAAACVTSVAASAGTLPLTFHFDAEIVASIAPEIPVGSYPNAGTFTIDRVQLTDRPETLIDWRDVTAFHFSIGALSWTQADVENGVCLVDPCGALFSGSTVRSIVGQYAMPAYATGPRWVLRLNSNPPGAPAAQFVSIEDLSLGVTVASGPLSIGRQRAFGRHAVPEPSVCSIAVEAAALLLALMRVSLRARRAPRLGVRAELLSTSRRLVRPPLE